MSIQETAQKAAQRYIDLANKQCQELGIPLTEQQQLVIHGTIVNILEPQMKERTQRFMNAVIESAENREKIKSWDTEKLADALINDVWSMMKIGTVESDLVESAADRLRLLCPRTFVTHGTIQGVYNGADPTPSQP